MKNEKSVIVTVVTKPARKVIIKRGIKAEDYCSYCQEAGCDVWDKLVKMTNGSNEPVCLWLPKKYIKQNTSKYVQGVEVELSFKGNIPEGFDIIELPQAKYLMFQGEPFNEEDYEDAITSLWKAIDEYNPSALGYTWDDENPRIQLEPVGSRGYIELKAVK